MSGHSKWSRIKRKKAVVDNKRGQEFTKLTKQIIAVIQGNPNPEQNTALREAITRARQANMPQGNIDKLLARQSQRVQESVIYEAFGLGGAALLIVTQTDNPKRTVAEVRALLKKAGGTMSEPGGVMWKFKKEEAGNYIANYPLEMGLEDKKRLDGLVDTLSQQQDVEAVFTDAGV